MTERRRHASGACVPDRLDGSRDGAQPSRGASPCPCGGHAVAAIQRRRYRRGRLHTAPAASRSGIAMLAQWRSRIASTDPALAHRRGAAKTFRSENRPATVWRITVAASVDARHSIKVFGNAGVLPFLHFANGIPGAGGGLLLVEFTNVIDNLAVVRQFARRAKGDIGAKVGDIANCGYYRVDAG